jgi:adenylate kinase
MLAEELKVPYLSSGHIFREMAKEKTATGRYVKETINSGALMPDDQTIKVIREYLAKPDYKNGYILDGFPRTVPQAEAFEGDVDKVVFIDVSDKEALWRISGRVSDRQDETVQAIRKRINLFHSQTEAVIDHYRDQGMLIQVDGEQEVEVVFKSIMKHLK